MKILWMSRHTLMGSQIAGLRQLDPGPIEIIHDPNTFGSAADIVARFRHSGADELALVAPLGVIQEVLELGVKPLWAEMVVVRDHRGFRRALEFRRWRRITAIEIRFEDEEQHNPDDLKFELGPLLSY